MFSWTKYKEIAYSKLHYKNLSKMGDYKLSASLEGHDDDVGPFSAIL